jgi:hypothetical protein
MKFLDTEKAYDAAHRHFPHNETMIPTVKKRLEIRSGKCRRIRLITLSERTNSPTHEVWMDSRNRKIAEPVCMLAHGFFSGTRESRYLDLSNLKLLESAA